MTLSIWTGEKIELVSQMVALCMPSTKIAKAMTDQYNQIFTKNSIIGICNRAGIKWPGGRKKRSKKSPRGSVRMRQQVRNFKYYPQDQDIMAVFQEYHGEEKSMLDLKNDECRFPLENGNTHVCCGHTISKSNYCQHHYDICYKKTGTEVPI